MEYQLFIKISFEAMDDIEARQKLKDMTKDNKVTIDNAEMKLREILPNEAPRGISI